jgi:hypothetical protein
LTSTPVLDSLITPTGPQEQRVAFRYRHVLDGFFDFGFTDRSALPFWNVKNRRRSKK